VLVSLAFTKEEESIAWSPNYILTWKDFKALPNYNSGAAAVTASGISYSLSAYILGDKTEVDCKVFAYFYPKQSWYKKEHSNDIILAHERLHFDITELHARKMRRMIANAKFDGNVKQTIKQMYNQVIKELDSMQGVYDAQTNYSRNIEQQKAWQQKVKQLLQATKGD
jgi:hypothetical protein